MVKLFKKLLAKLMPMRDNTIYTARIFIIFQQMPYYSSAMLTKQFNARQLKAVSHAIKSNEISTLKEYPGNYITKHMKITGNECTILLERIHTV